MTQAQSEIVYVKLKEIVAFSCSVDADYRQFPTSWLFHYRWTGKKESSIDGRAISFVTVGSRTSAFVPSLQKVTGALREVKAKKSTKKETKEDEPADPMVKSTKVSAQRSMEMGSMNLLLSLSLRQVLRRDRPLASMTASMERRLPQTRQLVARGLRSLLRFVRM